MVDTTAPFVVVLNGVSNGATYTLGAVPAASPAPPRIQPPALHVQATLSITGGTANGVGHFTATCSGASRRRRQYRAAPVSAGYDVHYIFSGFLTDLSPDGPDGKTFRAGSTVTVKWRLQNAQGAFIVTSVRGRDDPGRAGSFLRSGSGRALPLTPTSPATACRKTMTASSSIGRRPVWLTGCYAFLLPLDDGTVQSAVVQLR